jgi:hypothetical protein
MPSRSNSTGTHRPRVQVAEQGLGFAAHRGAANQGGVDGFGVVRPCQFLKSRQQPRERGQATVSHAGLVFKRFDLFRRPIEQEARPGDAFGIWIESVVHRRLLMRSLG